MRKSPYRFQDSSFDEVSINLTPLIDVVFVVLIIFIIIAPMVEFDRVELADAGTSLQKQTLTASETHTISIHVHKDNTIWINGMKVDIKQLIPLLKEIKAANPTKKPQLFQDKQACFGTYQSVKNALESAGFEELDVVLKPG